MIPEEHKALMESEEYVEEIILPLAILAGKMVYSRYFSKEAKKCADKSGFIKSRCITRARIAAMAAQVRQLTKHRETCVTKKHKRKCKDTIDKKIRDLKSKRHRLSIKLVQYNYRQKEIARQQKERKSK